jgi:hypothetical protein
MANTTPTGAGSNGGTTTVVANPPNPPTVNTVPNTTTDTKVVEYQKAASESVFDPRQDVGENVFDPNAALPNPAVTAAAQLNDPYAGLSPSQLQKLGGADPTDPFIRARLGIPQLPGSALPASGFSFAGLTTGFSPIDNALGTIGSLFGGLFTKTTKTSVAGATDYGSAYKTPDYNTAELSKQATQVRATDSTLTTDAKTNLTNINEANAQIDKANENTQANNRSILANEDAQAAAQEQQRQAQAIIDQNNAELADENLPDDRRAELEANNAAQLASIAENAAVIDEAQNNIDSATSNNEAQQASILENEMVAQENADAFVINNNGDGPTQVSALEDPATENVFDPGETINANGESVFDPTAVDPNSDPFEEARFQAELAAQEDPPEIVLTPDEQAAADDPFEQRRLELEQEANRAELTEQATDVEPGDDPFEEARRQAELAAEENEPIEFEPADVPFLTDEEADALDAEQAENRRVLATEATDVEPGLFSGQTDEFGGVDEAVAARQAENVDATQDLQNERNDAAAVDAAAAQESNVAANSQAATKLKAKNQATLQSRYKQTGDTDWRVRLMLAESSDYLYNASDSDILTPLKATNGVIFPYTPNITVNYQANYEQYDLTHSNYRGVFYKNSRVGDISLRGTFTAQDTTEASYMLAVIHFFRSVTKMFYGKDEQRGTPPPLVYLAGYGDFQFKEHPCLVSSFNYVLPNDVDYIRAVNPNNYGINMLGRRSAPLSSVYPGIAGALRLANALIPKGAVPTPPAPGVVTQNVSNTQRATYVPTKMEVDISLIPVQTRDQVSKQFSLKGFANGNLLKGGFW